jgi:hypothetical protein
MKNIIEIIKEAGLTLTDEQTEAINKAVAENYKTVAEFDKKVGKITSERDTLQTQYDDVKKSLASFDGVNVDDLKRQIADANTRAKEAEENAKKTIAQRDYADLVKQATDGLKFTSESAKKQFMAELTAKNIPVENGKLMGLGDWIEEYRKNDPNAIVDKDADGNKAKFTDSMNPNAGPDADLAEENKMRAAFGLPPKKGNE